MGETFTVLVFGGGGTRCFWQGGVLSVAREAVPAPQVISTVSGGTLSGAAMVADRERMILDLMCDAFDRAERRGGNVRPTGMIDGTEDTFIHEDVYREVVREVLGDQEAADRIASGPEFRVHLAKPSWLGQFASQGAYAADLFLNSTPHVSFAEQLGAEEVVVDLRQATREGRLLDLVIASATLAPFFTPAKWKGENVMDGGIIDNAPVPAGEGRALVLVTRQYENLPERDDRVYIQPSSPVPTVKLDFTDRDGIEAAWELGEKDGRQFLETWRRS